MKMLWLIPIALIVGAFLVWQLWLTLLIGVKEPAYNVVTKKDGYEIRKVQPYLTAQVDVKGSYETSINEGFKILFAYISGNNHSQTCLKLKVPLLHEVCQRGVEIPMTAPVLVQENEQHKFYRVSFILPKGYTLETAPKPRDQRIILTEEPAKIIAVYRFTLYPTIDRVEKETETFTKLLKRDGMRVRSNIWLARYNPPFVLPFFMRNELMVTVEEALSQKENE